MTPTMDARSESVEAMARAMVDARGYWSDGQQVKWSGLSPRTQHSYLVMASAALDAVLQPTEPCATCGGMGVDARVAEHTEEGWKYSTCPACSGGLVQRREKRGKPLRCEPHLSAISAVRRYRERERKKREVCTRRRHVA